MAYTYPQFARVSSIRQEVGKRYSMEIDLDSEGCQTWVVILNLIPWYETYSERLRKREKELSDPENLKTIEAYLSAGNPCIIAWGNPPTGLAQPYAVLSEDVRTLLSRFGNSVYHVGALTRLGYPRHGQIWGYTDPMRKLK